MEFSSEVSRPHSILCAWLFLVLLLHAKSRPVERLTYIIHMDKSAMPKAFVNHHSWYSSIIASLDLANPTTLEDKHHLSSPSIIYTYDNVFYGFNALLSLDKLETLKNFPGFMSSYEDSVVIPATMPLPPLNSSP
ncbi:hypothetical protein FH972_013961 [Carpinus fangiana]|uniref:Inhibitor I9 domain-containing protein n=1 Tax=Carpinus fangiana TaxID=176857 RepID=A0A5N6RAY7_9ROSI|nr:hypothetical protein FH972_013961 [Carpinus fangiana]